MQFHCQSWTARYHQVYASHAKTDKHGEHWRRFHFCCNWCGTKEKFPTFKRTFDLWIPRSDELPFKQQRTLRFVWSLLTSLVNNIRQTRGKKGLIPKFWLVNLLFSCLFNSMQNSYESLVFVTRYKPSAYKFDYSTHIFPR